ncbi:MAG TPA: hypothetical protein VFM23_01160 [Gemmatimonadales bacterium]|nr:hypothetical protein [Gemmatimonadales bacterium]
MRIRLARIPGESQIGRVQEYSQVRVRVERRVRPDRRTGLDRRITDRRVRHVPVMVERRALGGSDRRNRGERRSPTPRRKLQDRRGSGLTLDLTPS